MNDNLPSILQDFKDITFQVYFDSSLQLDSFSMKLDAICNCASLAFANCKLKAFNSYLNPLD